MKNVLILGAGMVAGPVVCELSKQYHVTLLDRSEQSITNLLKKIRQVTGSSATNVTALVADHDSEQFPYQGRMASVSELIRDSDLVVSLLPATMHAEIARKCIEFDTHLVTSSYASLEMAELGVFAQEKGVILINECGVDPGIDHMSAMKLIDKLKKQGKTITSFSSFCGGLPAVEGTNPFNYQFSWSPLGVLRAAKSSAKFVKNSEVQTIASGTLFQHPFTVKVLKESFEGYYNRSSIQYMEKYDIQDANTFIRGTLRYKGWSHTMQVLNDLHYLEEVKQSLGGVSYRTLLRTLIACTDELVTAKEARKAAAAYLEMDYHHPVFERLAWLGLFSAEPIPEGVNNPLVALNRLMLKKMSYEEGQQDKIVMHHEIITTEEIITSSLVFRGEPDDFSAMALTVGLPVAYASQLVLEGAIKTYGLVIPTIPELYNPILQRLNSIGVSFVEKKRKLNKK